MHVYFFVFSVSAFHNIVLVHSYLSKSTSGAIEEHIGCRVIEEAYVQQWMMKDLFLAYRF